MGEHLIFFDANCPLCRRAVQYVIELDKKQLFLFAPLAGETASAILCGPLESYRGANSLVLLEHYESTERRFWIRSQAIFRIYWLMGNRWGLFGILSFLPSCVGDFFYKWAASHRHQFKLWPTQPLEPKERFLP